MNSKQRAAIIFGMLAIFVMVLVPPWQSGSYGLIFDAPHGGSIDVVRLLVQSLLVAIPTAALFLAFKSDGNVAVAGTGSANVRKSDGLAVVAAVGFACIITGAGGWYYFDQQQKELRAKELELKVARDQRQQQLREQELAAKEAEERKAEEEKQAAIDRLMAESASQQADDGKAKLRSLATARNWKKVRTDNNVSALLQTYWKDNLMYYRLQLTGSPEAMEMAAANHHSFDVEIKDSDGMSILSAGIQPGQLKLYSNKKGVWNTMVTDNLVMACRQDTYEHAVSWALTIEH